MECSSRKVYSFNPTTTTTDSSIVKLDNFEVIRTQNVLTYERY